MIPSPAAKAKESIDPSDTADYLVDLTPLLEASESFTSITYAVLPESAALGFTLLLAAPFAPAQVSNSQVKIYVTVAQASRSKSAWKRGTYCAVVFDGTTDSVPPRTFQRTAAIRVVQR